MICHYFIKSNTLFSSAEHLTALSHQSQNKTTLLFVRVYRDRASHAHPSISSLYEDIRTLLRNTGELGSPPSKDLAYTTKKFFRNIFPVAYHNILKMDSKQFSPEYELCLKDAYDAVQPFGDVPQEVRFKIMRAALVSLMFREVLPKFVKPLHENDMI